MDNALKNSVQPRLNPKDLRAAIESICEPFGKVTYFATMPVREGPKLRTACLIHLDSSAAEDALQRTLQVNRTDGGLLFFTDQNEQWNGPLT